MKAVPVTYHPHALADLADIWGLVADNDGADRADRLVARIEAACQAIGAVPHIGTLLKGPVPGVRSTRIKGVRSGALVFHSTPATVTILRISYLGSNVWTNIPSLDVDNPIDLSAGEP